MTYFTTSMPLTERRIQIPSQQNGSGDDPLDQVLQLCLQGRWEPAALQAVQILASQAKLDWNAWHQRVEYESLAPLLCSLVRSQNLVPLPIERKLRQAYIRTAAHNTFLLNELDAVVTRLAAEGVGVVLLKGAALAEEVYRNVALRPMLDLDLLVRREDMPASLQILTRLGYASTQLEPQAGARLAYESEVMLCKPGPVKTPIELHWSLFDSPYYQHALGLDWFWQTARPMRRLGPAAAMILGPEAQLLHLCGHLRLHHSGRELLWLHDVAEVIGRYRAQIDWEQLLVQAQACELVLPLQQVLSRVSARWGVPIPDAVLARLQALPASAAERRVFAWLTADHRPAGQRFWVDLASTSGWRPRLGYAWAQLFPSLTYLQHRYQVCHPVLAPLYYPYRWLLGLKGYFGQKTP